jgi:hypothetical protein
MKSKSEKNVAILVKKNKKRSCPFPFLSSKRKDGYLGSLELVSMDEKIATCCIKSLVPSR